MENIPDHTIHPPTRSDLLGHLRIITPSGFTIHRDIDFKYDYKTPSVQQQEQLTASVIEAVQIHEEQYKDVFTSIGREDQEIESEQVWVNGKIRREDYNDSHPKSIQLKNRLIEVYKEYENKQFFPYSPTVFDLFTFDKLNRYTVGETEDNFIYLNVMKITDKIFNGCLPMLFQAFNHKNFYTHRGIRFTFIHDIVSKGKRVKWHFPITPYIDDFKKIPVIPQSMIFESQRTFDTTGTLVSSGVRIFADHNLIDEVCDKHKIPHPLPIDRKARPWCYEIMFDGHGRILEIAALVKVYRRKAPSFTFKSSY